MNPAFKTPEGTFTDPATIRMGSGTTTRPLGPPRAVDFGSRGVPPSSNPTPSEYERQVAAWKEAQERRRVAAAPVPKKPLAWEIPKPPAAWSIAWNAPPADPNVKPSADAGGAIVNDAYNLAFLQ